MGFKDRNKFDEIETIPLLEVGDTAKVPIELEDKSEDDLFFEDEFKEVSSGGGVRGPDGGVGIRCL